MNEVSIIINGVRYDAMRREIYAVCDFKDYQPRKNFVCKEYFK
jgi:hypothetical protein